MDYKSAVWTAQYMVSKLGDMAVAKVDAFATENYEAGDIEAAAFWGKVSQAAQLIQEKPPRQASG